MRKPRMTAKVARGLDSVAKFAGADLECVKPEDYGKDWLDDARTAVEWCSKMHAWYMSRPSPEKEGR